jgi:hypothetical protein
VLSPARGLADSLVLGHVRDSVTGASVIGAQVSIKKGNDALGSGSSDSEGNYSVAIRMPNSSELSTLTIHVNHNAYSESSTNIQIKSGAPTERNYPIALLPRDLGVCLGNSKHVVVVGHFRAPLGQSFTELPGRIAEALQFNLLTRLQEATLPPALQPSFEPCEKAYPRALPYGKSLARALRAHAVLFGNVTQGVSGYDVNTYVSDAYDIFAFPVPYANQSVNLNNPSEAEMSPKTYEAVLAAVAAGLEKSEDLEKTEKCKAVITVINAAERIVGEVTPPLAKIRGRCQQQLPHVGLLSGGK